MKRATFITSALLAGMMAAGIAGQASAMPDGGQWTLQNGSTPSRPIPGVDHYRIEVHDNHQLTVTSQQWSPEGGNVRLNAVLRDSNGNAVARSRDNGKDFVLEHALQSGKYTLEVHGATMGVRQQSTQRYYLRSDLR